jgi:hypothetical protein
MSTRIKLEITKTKKAQERLQQYLINEVVVSCYDLVKSNIM